MILRAVWPEQTLTGEELLERLRKHGPFFSDRDLAKIEEAKRKDRPVDKWRKG